MPIGLRAPTSSRPLPRSNVVRSNWCRRTGALSAGPEATAGDRDVDGGGDGVDEPVPGKRGLQAQRGYRHPFGDLDQANVGWRGVSPPESPAAEREDCTGVPQRVQAGVADPCFRTGSHERNPTHVAASVLDLSCQFPSRRRKKWHMFCAAVPLCAHGTRCLRTGKQSCRARDQPAVEPAPTQRDSRAGTHAPH